MNFQLKINPSFDFNKIIPGYKKSIDEIDNKILNLLEERNRLSNKIGQCKKNMNKEVEDKDREYEVLIRLSDNSTTICNSELIKIYREIFNMSTRIRRNSGKFTLF